MNTENFEYCGDGIYAEFNNYCVDIHVNDHRNTTVATFEVENLQSLVNFVRSRGWKIN